MSTQNTSGHFLALTGTVQRNDPAARLRVAESAADIDAAERTMLAAAASCDELGRRSERDPLAEATICRDTAYAVRLCAMAVDRLFEAAGGSAPAEHEPLAPPWRGVHGARIPAALTWDAAGPKHAPPLPRPVGS